MKRRSGEAIAAQHRNGGPMKHRLQPKGGAKNPDYQEDEDTMDKPKAAISLETRMQLTLDKMEEHRKGLREIYDEVRSRKNELILGGWKVEGINDGLTILDSVISMINDIDCEFNDAAPVKK